MSVRTVRFYAGRGLIPPPRREGRNGYYGPDHLARLELVRELQAHGFTLSAIEGYLENIPTDATPEQVALHRTLLAPWMADLPETVTRADLEMRSGRSLSDDDLELLIALGVIEPTPDRGRVPGRPGPPRGRHPVPRVGLPTEAALAARRIFTSRSGHGDRDSPRCSARPSWPALESSGQPAEEITTMIERFKPLTIQALVTAYETAVDEAKRETVRRRS